MLRMGGDGALKVARRLGGKLNVTPPALAAVREAPTPIVFMGGSSWHTSFSWPSRLQNALTTGGYTTATFDILGFGDAPSPLSATATLDALCDDAHQQLSKYPAPVVVAHSLYALLAHHYLESYPLAALVMVNPLPLNRCKEWLWRHVGAGTTLDDGAPAEDDILHWLRGCVSDEEATRAALLHDGISDADVEACFAASERAMLDSARTTDGNTCSTAPPTLCGLAASARLLRLLATHPVKLEPQPVPMLLVSGGRDALVSADDVAATAEYHQLDADDVAVLPSLGHVPFGAEAETAIMDAILPWIEKRF